MKRRYSVHAWVAGTYRAVGTPQRYWTRGGAELAVSTRRMMSHWFDYTIRDNKTGKSWPA